MKMKKKNQTSKPVLLADVGQKLIAAAAMNNATSVQHAMSIATHEEKMLAVQIRIARNLQDSLETQKDSLDFLDLICDGVMLLNSQFARWLRSTANLKAQPDDSGEAGQRYTGISGHERSLGDTRSEANKDIYTRVDLLLKQLLPVERAAFLSQLAHANKLPAATPSAKGTLKDGSRKNVRRVPPEVASDAVDSKPPF
jgi:hypothetical protein